MFVKKMVFNTLFAIGMSLPVLAFAANDLVITNDTNYPSTSKMNPHKAGGGVCTSSIPGIDGVTQPHQPKTTPNWQVRVACILDLENCQAFVYPNTNCSGNPIAKVVLSVSSGIKDAQVLQAGYSIPAHGAWDIKISGGPPAAK